ncbi:uncharacterized protein [Engystomops pustulosus]|uniref:uncharacterized protein n=1 Tax=Engystomops pustulosus TaxID=76066 RepID=UPI003AFA6FCA
MDFRSRESNWLSMVTQVFNCDSRGSLVGNDETKEAQMSVKNLLKKRIKIWWNKAALEQYLAKDLVPRGLRVQVYPSFALDDEVIRKRWEETCNTCSRTFIEILIGIEKKKLENIELELATVQDKIKTLLSPDNLSKFEQDLNNECLKWEKDTQAVKTKKFHRDMEDFQKQRAYRWQRVNSSRPIRRSGSTTSIDTVASDSSCSAAEGPSGRRPLSQQNRGTPMKRKYNNQEELTSGKLKPRKTWKYSGY